MRIDQWAQNRASSRPKGDAHGDFHEVGGFEVRNRTSATRKPTIALVAASLDILGGQGIQARALAEHLRGEGVRVRLIPVNPAFPRGLGWLRRHRYLRTVVNELLYIPALAALRKVDVVHIFSASYYSFLLGPAPALLAAKLLGKRVIINYHSGEAEDHLRHWGIFVHPWLRMADEIVVPSVYLRRVFSRFGYRVRVINNVIDISRFPFRERTVLSPRLLSIRNLEDHYRIDVIIRAFALVQRKYPQATLVVAGYGSQEQRLRRLAATLGVLGLTFAGRYDPDDAASLYDGADLVLNASEVDNQPVSVLEAFACGLPVISTPTGDIGAMLQGGAAGVIVRRGDAAAMAGAVDELLENPLRALQLTRRAREGLWQFTWAQVRGRWANVYEGG